MREFIETTQDHIGRIYHFTDARYYSVTTALGNTADKQFLVEWRERIGDEQADELVKKAQMMGTQFHLLGEYFLKNKPVEEKIHPFVKVIFTRMKPLLRKNITKVHAVEQVLYSDVIKLAGRTDALVDWNHEPAVFDYKLVNYWIDEYIHDYWLQATIYAHMWEYLAGVKAKKLVLAIGNKKTGLAKCFEDDPRKYAHEAVDRIQQFRAMVA